MGAGEFDRRVTFRRKTSVPNEYNEPVVSWSDLMTVWAKYEPVSDGERMRAQQVGAWLTARFTIKWSRQAAALDARDELVFEGRTFGISIVKEVGGRRRRLEVTANASADTAPR